jgi:acetamidase/formamidase
VRRDENDRVIHQLEPVAGQVVDVFDPAAPPAVVVRPGERLRVRTLDAGGHLEPWTHLGQERRQLFPTDRGHCLAGPIHVQGAEPGDVLAVRIESLVPGGWGYTIAGFHDDVLNRSIGTAGGEPAFLHWSIGDGRAANQHGVAIPTRPFLGIVGTTPAEPGEHSTIPPRPGTGGNIDCRELVAGSTVYLPVEVAGAGLCVGDGHAAQGDGEVGGTAIECGMTTELVVGVVREPVLEAVHAETPAGKITFGFDADLNSATASALGAMLTWLQHLLGVGRKEALAYASVVVDLRVTQVANGTWGVHALLPSAADRSLSPPENATPRPGTMDA